MSMISEQVKKIRSVAGICTIEVKKTLLEAADTIESLSAKLQAANMERSEIYYGDKKQRSLTINIQIGKDESKSDIMQLILEIIGETNDKGYGVMNAVVDGMEIFDYKGFSKEFFDSEEQELIALQEFVTIKAGDLFEWMVEISQTDV